MAASLDVRSLVDHRGEDGQVVPAPEGPYRVPISRLLFRYRGHLMESKPNRLHPLVAAAAGSVILLSLVGIAVFMGWLPRSDSASPDTPDVPVAEIASPAPTAEPEPAKPAVRAEAPAKPRKTAESRPAAPAPVPKTVPVAEAVPVTPPAPPVCSNCGVVEFVQTHEQPASAGEGMIGTVVGGVVGGVLGNQVGSGDGKKLATAAGAVGGALAGRKIEQSRRARPVTYAIGVRFEDGRLQTFTQDIPPSVSPGQRVRSS